MKFMFSLSTGRIETDSPNPSLSGSDKTYPSSCFRPGASVKGLGGKRSKDVCVYFPRNS